MSAPQRRPGGQLNDSTLSEITSSEPSLTLDDIREWYDERVRALEGRVNGLEQELQDSREEHNTQLEELETERLRVESLNDELQRDLEDVINRSGEDVRKKASSTRNYSLLTWADQQLREAEGHCRALMEEHEQEARQHLAFNLSALMRQEEMNGEFQQSRPRWSGDHSTDVEAAVERYRQEIRLVQQQQTQAEEGFQEEREALEVERWRLVATLKEHERRENMLEEENLRLEEELSSCRRSPERSPDTRDGGDRGLHEDEIVRLQSEMEQQNRRVSTLQKAYGEARRMYEDLVLQRREASPRLALLNDHSECRARIASLQTQLGEQIQQVTNALAAKETLQQVVQEQLFLQEEAAKHRQALLVQVKEHTADIDHTACTARLAECQERWNEERQTLISQHQAKEMSREAERDQAMIAAVDAKQAQQQLAHELQKCHEQAQVTSKLDTALQEERQKSEQMQEVLRIVRTENHQLHADVRAFGDTYAKLEREFKHLQDREKIEERDRRDLHARLREKDITIKEKQVDAHSQMLKEVESQRRAWNKEKSAMQRSLDALAPVKVELQQALHKAELDRREHHRVVMHYQTLNKSIETRLSELEVRLQQQERMTTPEPPPYMRRTLPPSRPSSARTTPTRSHDYAVMRKSAQPRARSRSPIGDGRWGAIVEASETTRCF